MNWEYIPKIDNPIALTAFALALAFGGLSRVKAYRWWPPVAMSLAVVSVIGGLTLAYVESMSRGEKPTAAASPSASKIETHGAGSHIINGNDVKNGNLNININESVRR